MLEEEKQLNKSYKKNLCCSFESLNTYLVKGGLTREGGSTNVAAKGLRRLLLLLKLLLLLQVRRRRFRGVVIEEAVDLQALHVLER